MPAAAGKLGNSEGFRERAGRAFKFSGANTAVHKIWLPCSVFEFGEIGQILRATHRTFISDEQRFAQEGYRQLIQFRRDFGRKSLLKC